MPMKTLHNMWVAVVSEHELLAACLPSSVDWGWWPWTVSSLKAQGW